MKSLVSKFAMSLAIAAIGLHVPVFGQTKIKLPSTSLSDLTASVDIPTLHIRIIYPKSERTNPTLSVEEGIYFLDFYAAGEVSIGVEIATRHAIASRADSAKAQSERYGTDLYPFETDSDFVHRLNVFQKGLVYDFFEQTLVAHNRKFGIARFIDGLGIGRTMEAYSYIDSFQVIVRYFNYADSIARKVHDIFEKQLTMQYDNRYQDLAHELIYDLVRRDFIKILPNIRIEKY